MFDYLPAYPAYGLASLGCGSVMLFSSTSTYLAIYRGSRSNFAYTLVAFTFATAVQYICLFLINGFP